MSKQLLLKIARCPELALARNEPTHPCHSVVRAQLRDLKRRGRQAHLPEPWSGHIANAKIVFVGTNPSVDYDERFPIETWRDEDIVDFFENRFGEGRREWTLNGTEVLHIDGRYARTNRTWTEIINRAAEILGQPAMPGIDYAITQMVRCKSKDARGVPRAQEHCMKHYLLPTLEATPAGVIVVLGKARGPVGLRTTGVALGPRSVRVSVGGIYRVLIGLGKPGSNEKRRIPVALPRGQADLNRIRRFL